MQMNQTNDGSRRRSMKLDEARPLRVAACSLGKKSHCSIGRLSDSSRGHCCGEQVVCSCSFVCVCCSEFGLARACPAKSWHLFRHYLTQAAAIVAASVPSM
ncbi:hypothetical protein GQ42DRAFT_88350 [Ramicandelaber brevisporus]|nr:hypothetical protein GQ42DRAFT_88350 [Ramicandelaber brevisporus]